MFFRRTSSKENESSSTTTVEIAPYSFQEKMNLIIEANMPLMGYVFLMLEPEDWISCEQVCRSWRKFLKEWFYVQDEHKKIIEAKVVAWAWSRKDPLDREFTLPKGCLLYTSDAADE